MTIQEMTANFDILAHAYYFGAIAYIAFLFCCHIIDVFQALKADYRAKFVAEDLLPSQLSIEPSPHNMTLRQLRDYVRVHNLQSQVKTAVGRSVSHCSKDDLVNALA